MLPWLWAIVSISCFAADHVLADHASRRSTCCMIQGCIGSIKFPVVVQMATIFDLYSGCIKGWGRVQMHPLSSLSSLLPSAETARAGLAQVRSQAGRMLTSNYLLLSCLEAKGPILTATWPLFKIPDPLLIVFAFLKELFWGGDQEVSWSELVALNSNTSTFQEWLPGWERAAKVDTVLDWESKNLGFTPALPFICYCALGHGLFAKEKAYPEGVCEACIGAAEWRPGMWPEKC